MNTTPDTDAAVSMQAQAAARQVCLLPRHWAWLAEQPSSASAALRWLVDDARHDKDGRYRVRQAKEACYWYMRDAAGDRAHFEAAIRALFAGEVSTLQSLIASWPVDIREKIHALSAPIGTDVAETRSPP
ncbi:DUF2239 family protein [Dyella silvatica]|uniref:DUF2239 family protein n=1 Tax=Dyella silvatica TaxID=2992128 RepID=UPI00224D51AC|nr:DUF2239 family protein [Dyella silvatica]